MAWKLVWTEDDAGVPDGLATLDGAAKVVQDPASAQEAAAAGKIPIAMPDGKLAPAWIPTVPHAATHQHGGADEVATAAPAADAIPKALSDGKLAVGWLPAGEPSGVAALDASKFVLGSGLVVAGDQVVGARAGAIADPAGGMVIDGMCRAAVIQILNALRGHGLIQP
ncbi:MAG: hypothetical protein HMLKMBBP_00552 [Planctomycetes bacterium]|nr:hypothetical protein [Planctomycetota bacterium]